MSASARLCETANHGSADKEHHVSLESSPEMMSHQTQRGKHPVQHIYSLQLITATRWQAEL